VPALPVFGPLDAAASLLHQRAALHLRRGDLDGAVAVFDRLHALPGLSAEHRGSALACLSVLRTRQAAAPALPEEARSRLLAGADIALREATALVVGAGGRKPSFADMSRVGEEEVSALEEAAADPLASAAAAAAAASRAAGGAAAGAGSAAAAAGSAEAAAAEAARVAARAAVARKRRHAKRARRRDAYVAALKVRSPEFAALGVLPKPDPERWLPKRERTYGKKSRRRQIAKAAMAVTSGGAQGSAAASEAAMRELDAKAKADAAKASGKAGAGSAAGTPMTSPAGKKKPAGKGGRR